MNKTNKRKSLNTQTHPKLYSIGVVENAGTYKVVDSFQYKKTNQYRQDWCRVDAREVARKLNRGTLVIK